MAEKRIRSYRDLQVWQKAHSLAKNVLKACQAFPNSIEARVVREQLVKAVTSVTANIAEGYGGVKVEDTRITLQLPADRQMKQTTGCIYLKISASLATITT